VKLGISPLTPHSHSLSRAGTTTLTAFTHAYRDDGISATQNLGAVEREDLAVLMGVTDRRDQFNVSGICDTSVRLFHPIPETAFSSHHTWPELHAVSGTPRG